MTTERRKSGIPSWIVALVVLLTAGMTVFAMLKAGYRPVWGKTQPVAPLGLLPWATDSNASLGDLLPFGTTAAAQQPVATVAPMPLAAPPLPTPLPAMPATAAIDGTNRPPAHGDRGICTSCHTVTDARGVPVPPIQALSPLPHAYRGVCVNCHAITTRPQQSAVQQAAYTNCPIQPVAGVAPAAPVAAAPTPAAPVATEGEWLGMEVSPISPITATQFKLPEGTFGLIVVEAEGQAATVGLKPGDVLVGVNGAPVGTMTDFFGATQNGTMAEADVQVTRKGQLLQFRVSATAVAPVAPAAPPAPPANAAGPQCLLPPPGAGAAGAAPPLRVQP